MKIREAELMLAALLAKEVAMLLHDDKDVVGNNSKMLAKKCADKLINAINTIIDAIDDDIGGVPNLVNVRVTEKDGRTYTRFEATFHRQPVEKEIIDAQRRAGYAPEGYGGPYLVRGSQGTTFFTVRWECMGSCD